MKQSAALAVDFAALRTLRLVYEHRSFTSTAVFLNINQSAVSYTIEKLRKAFNDPLFFRQGGKVVPTERCSEIIGSVTRMIDEFEQLTTPATFDPETEQHRFTIACNYYERQLIIPHVVAALRSAAPGIRLETINSTSEGDQQLKRSEADLLIGPLRPEENEFFSRTLLNEHYVCIMDAANPLAGAPLTLENYVGSKHVTVTYGGTWKSRYLIALERMGVKLSTVMAVPSPAGIEKLIAGTDLVATIPSRLAGELGPSVHVADCPCPAPFDVHLVWTTRTHHSPRHAWLRDLISERIKASAAP
jgi:DNA-binding transcriptional LysR family regulator